MSEKKKISPIIVFIPIILAIIILIVIPTGKKELKIARVSIISEKGDYFISFDATNNTNNIVESKLEANVTYPRLHGKGGRTWDKAGKKQFIITLEPKEKKEFREKIDLILPPKAIFQNFRDLLPQIQILSISQKPV